MRKVNYRSFSARFAFLALMLFLAFGAPVQAQDAQAGEKLFKSNCAACHKLDAKGVGPALRGVGEKFEREWLYKWIKNSMEMVNSGDPQAVALFEEWNGAIMTPFPGLSDEDIDNILAYTDQEKAEPAPQAGADLAVVQPQESESGLSSNVVLGLLAVLFLMLIVTLYVVNRTLKRVAVQHGVDPDEAGLSMRGAARKLAQNQFLMILMSVTLFLGGSYFAYDYLMQININVGYEPVQPIHFSHKIHAGDNKIDCQLCHSSARKSKTSSIPSLNMCMNCHMNITEYNGTVDPANGYTKEFYDGEIQKLYDAVGWDPEEREYTGEEEPVKWVRIHNLADFAYFNHAQHVTAGGLDCQKCHGPVEEMEIMSQHSPLTMGWCIECHRTTNVDLENNEYYSKIHEELSKKYGVEKLTVAQMGGIECGKCHY